MKFRKKEGKFVQLFQPKFILIYVDRNHFPNRGEQYQFPSLSIFLFTSYHAKKVAYFDVVPKFLYDRERRNSKERFQGFA